MRALYLGLAAALSVVALVLKLFDVSNLAAVIALLAAGVFLVLGLKVVAQERQPGEIVLDEEKRATLRGMLDRGDEGAAIRQVQLWFRDASPEQARRTVLELR
ncbi:hypothetical protein EAH68_09345 [Corynebacterium hylobatis]|uniref:Uncharacterized protein n=1 Tax=Corynebacterium hylobatis TaxID=1859290 RepID=A0A3R9ZIB7_9CORY|nr:hypothetical protein [Corynebacterium hylobatis]RSZ62340.1 hypothetical protein EAH68_09345 [Corynebacterium hylobatis]